MSIRNLHDQAMENLVLAAKYADPADSDANKAYFDKAFELENQAAQIALDDEKATVLTWSVLCRSAAWIAIKAEKYDEAEKIALTALARGTHPAEKNKLREVLFTAMKKQGIHDPTETQNEEHVEVDEQELATV